MYLFVSHFFTIFISLLPSQVLLFRALVAAAITPTSSCSYGVQFLLCARSCTYLRLLPATPSLYTEKNGASHQSGSFYITYWVRY